MEITRVTKNNYRFFAPFCFGQNFVAEPNTVMLGAIEDNVACGVAVFVIEDTIGMLTNLYVAPEYRKRNIATNLVRAFQDVAQNAGITAITAHFSDTKRNEMVPFLKANNFEIFEQSEEYKISLQTLEKSQLFRKYVEKTKKNECVSYQDLEAYQRNELVNFLRKQGFGKEWVNVEGFSEKISCVLMDRLEHITSCMLCSEYEGHVDIDLLCSTQQTPLQLFSVFTFGYQQLMNRKEPETEIHYLAANSGMALLGSQLFGEEIKKCGCIFYGVKSI